MQANNFFEVLGSTPVIPDYVYEALPPFLKDAIKHFTDSRERDVVLTSSLTILSECFSSIKGRYGKDWVGPNLFTFIVAPPANGKSSMKYAAKIGNVIQENFEKANAIARAEYEMDYKEWKIASKRNPVDAGPSKKAKVSGIVYSRQFECISHLLVTGRKQRQSNHLRN